MRKPLICICEDEDQPRGSRETDQRLCFCFMDSTFPLFPVAISIYVFASCDISSSNSSNKTFSSNTRAGVLVGDTLFFLRDFFCVDFGVSNRFMDFLVYILGISAHF